LKTAPPIRSLLCALALVSYLFLVTLPAARQPNTNGFAAYYTASKILIERPNDLASVYDNLWFQQRIDEFGFNHVRDIFNAQPPTMSLMMAPIAWSSPSWARVIWVSLSVVLWFSGVALLVEGLEVLGISTSRRSVLLLVALTTAYVPLRDNFQRGQCYTLLLFLLCLFFRLALSSSRRSSWFAGVPLGLMLVLKTAGFWLWPLLFTSRRWRTLAGACGTATMVILFSFPFIGWAPWMAYLYDLSRLASDPVRYVTAYQTVTSLMGHLFVFDRKWNPAPIADLGRFASHMTVIITLLVFALSARLQRFRGGDATGRALSLGLSIAPIVTMAPIAESYHYVLVLPAFVVAFWIAFRKRASWSSWSLLVASLLLIEAPSRLYGSGLIKNGWMALLAYPRLYGAFALWIWFMRRLKTHGKSIPDRGPSQGTKKILA
jgi:hypothetical protein